jgi:hypothetical protein
MKLRLFICSLVALTVWFSSASAFTTNDTDKKETVERKTYSTEVKGRIAAVTNCLRESMASLVDISNEKLDGIPSDICPRESLDSVANILSKVDGRLLSDYPQRLMKKSSYQLAGMLSCAHFFKHSLTFAAVKNFVTSQPIEFIRDVVLEIAKYQGYKVHHYYLIPEIFKQLPMESRMDQMVLSTDVFHTVFGENDIYERLGRDFVEYFWDLDPLFSVDMSLIEHFET